MRATIHDTPAALRFGGDGALVTFAVPECDKAKAIALAALLRIGLVLTVEVDLNTENQTEPLTRRTAKQRV